MKQWLSVLRLIKQPFLSQLLYSRPSLLFLGGGEMQIIWEINLETETGFGLHMLPCILFCLTLSPGAPCPSLPYVARVPTWPVPWEPSSAPWHWSASLPHAARYRKGWWGRLFLPLFLSTGSTMRSREYSVENQKRTTVMTVSASLMDPSLAQDEQSTHCFPLEQRLLQPLTGKPKGKEAAAEPVPAPCDEWQD